MDREDSGTDDILSIYVYNGVGEVPEDVIHIRVAPTVTVIPQAAFILHQRLEVVELPEGLIRIEYEAFDNCQSLMRINIPSTVEEIGIHAFQHCRKLDRVVLPMGLRRLGADAFSYCKSLKQINIPPGIQHIERFALCDCQGLTDISLSEGLREIGEGVFSSCKSLVSVTLPSSLRDIGDEAFEGCERLDEIHMPETIESIGSKAFKGCNLTNFRFPSSIGNDVDISIVGENTSLVSIELPETIEQLKDYHYDDYGTELSVRNVALSSNCVIDTHALQNCTDLGLAFGVDIEVDADNDDEEEDTTISDALRHRFDNLPIHKICYYQSYHDTETTMLNLMREINPWTSKPAGQLNTAGKQQDCLGMTPLHILTCSTKQNVEMIYRLLIDKYPETLIMKDKWGDIPLLYALWCSASTEVVELLVESYKTFHPDYEFDWSGMILTLAKRDVPLTNIKKLITAQQRFSPEYDYNIQSIVVELAASDATREGCWYTSIETFQYLLRVSITDRLDSLDIKRWRIDMENCIKSLPDEAKNREHDTQAVYDRLATYESIKEGTSVLELAFWKAKIDESRNKKPRVDSQVSYRDQCRVNCGADLVIRNVLPYLLPK